MLRNPETKLAIHGTPVTPASLLAQLDGRSFCVSYMRPEQVEACIRLVDPFGMLLLDNGAFTAWRKGFKLDDAWWSGYYAWAAGILARCSPAIAVIPDVIDGDLADNVRLIEACPLPRHRVMPVWHLHEPLAVLGHLAARFDYLAFGSSGIYAKPGTEIWRRRMEEALAQVELVQLATGRRPWLHMMRGLGLLHAYPWNSADSSNVARNHCRTRGQPRHVGAMADRIEAKIAA